MSRRTAVVAAAALLLAGSALAAGPAGAQSVVTARLASQSLLLSADETATVVLDVAGTLPPDAEVAVVVHNRLPSDREALRQAAEGDIPTAPYRVLVSPAAEVPRDAGGRLAVTVPTTSRRSSATGQEIPLPTPGVYPVEILLRSPDTGEELARVVTFLVRVPDAPLEDPLQLSVVLPLVGPPALQPDGTTALDADLRSQVQVLTDLLAATTDVPLTVQVQPELLDALERTGLPTDESLRARLVAALGRQATVAATYVRTDPTAMVASGLGDELVDQLRRGEDVLADQLGSATERAIWASPDAVDERAVTALRDLGFRQLILPDGALVPDENAAGDRPTSLRAGDADRPLAVAEADSALSGAFGPHADPVRDAYVWLAELALVALAPPDDVDGPRGTVVAPTSWWPDPVFLSTVLAGLRGNPLVTPTTAAGWFEAVAPARTKDGAPVERTFAPADPSDLTGYAEDLRRTRSNLASYGSMLEPASPMPARLTELLEVSPSADLTPESRDAYLAAVETDLDTLRRSVDPVASRTITLAGRTTELPLTITARVDDPLTVKVRLSSSKLAFPEGNERVVTVEDGAAQVRVPVEARTSGTFPVNVQLLTPTGDRTVAPSTQLTVRSTGLSGLGLALSVGALLVLALWWLRHMTRARRRRRAIASSTRHPSTGAAPEAAGSPGH